VGAAPAAGGELVSFSFNIPLEEKPEGVHFVNPAGEEKQGPAFVPPVNCFGSAAEPTATPGQLCIYAEGEEKAEFVTGFDHRYSTGAVVLFAIQKEASAFGSWAVTAP
jgi:hypothetical protein